MGELMRSESMTLLQFVIPTDNAHDVVYRIGELGTVQFQDLNPNTNAFQKCFVNDLLRIDELQRKIRFFDEHVKKCDRDLSPDPSPPRSLAPQEIPEMESLFEEYQKELQQMSDAFDAINRALVSQFQLVALLQNYESFIGEYESQVVLEASSKLVSSFCGVVERSRVHAFERILWRATRGNIYFRSSDLEIEENEEEEKSIFTILFRSADHISSLIDKICQTFNVVQHECPDQRRDRERALEMAERQIAELKKVRGYNKQRYNSLVKEIAKKLKLWTNDLNREKAIYHTLNSFHFDAGHHTFIAEGWCPTSDVKAVTEAVRRPGKLPVVVRQIQPDNEVPPTFFRTNKFTITYQDIVDAYGIPEYKEVNPTVFTIITFPFLFGVMFGDVGHGLLLIIFALWLIGNEFNWKGKNLGEILSMLFEGRYVLLLMGVFAVFAGFMYNEVFGVAMTIFPPGWVTQEGTLTMARKDPDYVYPFGVDPYWHTATNDLYFYNSLKMKMSIILGVFQMSVGIVLSAVNAIFFRKWYNLFFEFIPQFLFMVGLFGYLCLLILFKWWTDFGDDDELPGLLNVFLNMFLSPTSFDESTALYSGQHLLQVILLLIGVISIPVMLFAKPLMLRRDHLKRISSENRVLLKERNSVEENPGLERNPVEANLERNSAKVNLERDTVEVNLESGKSVFPDPRFTLASRESGDALIQHDSLRNGSSVVKGPFIVDPDAPFAQPPPFAQVASFGQSAAPFAKSAPVEKNSHQIDLEIGPSEMEVSQFDMGETIIEQVIHTIEFVLGAISNTASYLRLWALSLAHAELSAVFYDLVAVRALVTLNPLFIFVGFAVWATLTVGVLMIMESLSAFLHALRLHWVEFNSKFFHGGAKGFRPFTFNFDESEGF